MDSLIAEGHGADDLGVIGAFASAATVSEGVGARG
jgi:hypothetical protein